MERLLLLELPVFLAEKVQLVGRNVRFFRKGFGEVGNEPPDHLLDQFIGSCLAGFAIIIKRLLLIFRKLK